MARLEDLPVAMAQRLRDLDCPSYDAAPFTAGPPLARRRVAIVSSAALHRRGEAPMAPGRSEFRALPSSLAAGDIVSTHVSVNYDRTGFIRDADTAFPVERLRELAGEGAIGSVADTHYAVMGSNDPAGWGPMADEIAAALRADSVDAVLFSPV